jgi:type IV secretion system protein VirB4
MFGIGEVAPDRPSRGGGPATGAAAKRTLAQPRLWARAQAENPLSRFVPFSSLLSAHDVVTRGGDYLRVWRLEGVAFECADEHTICERHEALCSLLRNLAGGQFAVWTHRVHRLVEDSLAEPRERGFARDLARAYAESMRGQRMMSNELYLTLVYRPCGSRLGRALKSSRRSLAEIVATQAEALRIMEERSALVQRVLRAFGPALLGVQSRKGRTYSEVAEFLAYLVNGVWRPVPVHPGPLYRTLPTSRLSFGADKLELRNGDDRRYGAFVDIQEYADTVEPGVLNALLYERSEFIETQSFSMLPRRDAMRALELQRDQLIASDDVVATQIAEMTWPWTSWAMASSAWASTTTACSCSAATLRTPGGVPPRPWARWVSRAACRCGRWTWWPTRPGSPSCLATGSGAPGKPSSRLVPSPRSPATTTSPAASAMATHGVRRSHCCARPVGSPST